MATQPKSSQQADDYTRTTKRLQSSVQRVRSQAGTGAKRQAALVEALNDLVAHLVEGHLWGAASPQAQEALRLSSGALFAEGAVSNYTDPGAAGRCGTALVHLSVVQLGLGLGDAARATISSWRGLAGQLDEFQIDVTSSPATAAWAEYCQASAALSGGDATGANAAVDALRARLLEDGFLDDRLVDDDGRREPREGFLLLDAQRLSSDARWQAGRHQDSLGFLHSAKRDYDAQALNALTEPDRHPRPVVERLAEPLFGLYRDYADRLAMTGDADLALVTRRALADHLRGLTTLIPAPTTTQLAATCADLSLDLVRVGRVPEALEAAQEAVRVAGVRDSSPTIRLLAHAFLAEVLLADGQQAEAKAGIEAALDADGTAASEPVQRFAAQVLECSIDPDSAEISPQLRDVARGAPGLHITPELRPKAGPEGEPAAGAGDAGRELAAERQRAHELEAQRREDAQRDLEQQRHERAEAERAAEADRATAEREAVERIRIEEQRRSEADEAERQELKRRRAERLRRHADEAAKRVQSQRAERRTEINELVETAEREGQGEAEVAKLRLELADLKQAELDAAAELQQALTAAELETTTAPPATSTAEHRTEAPEPVSEPVREAGPRDQEERAPEVAEPQKVSPAPPLPEPEAHAALAEAETALVGARPEGNRRATRQACERLVEQLRPLTQTDPASFGPRLREALEELSGMQLRGGDLIGSRAATKEAKALARDLS